MFRKISFIFIMCLIMITPQIAFAGLGVEKMTLQSASFDGRSLVYLYNDETGQEHPIYFQVPNVALDQVLTSSNPVTEARKQLYAAYMLFGLNERIGQLENTYLVQFDVRPDIDANFKIRFTNEVNDAKVAATQMQSSLKKSDYNVRYDDLAPLKGVADFDNAPEVDPNAPIEIEDGSGFDFTWLWALLVLAGVGGVAYAVFKKKGGNRS